MVFFGSFVFFGFVCFVFFDFLVLVFSFRRRSYQLWRLFEAHWLPNRQLNEPLRVPYSSLVLFSGDSYLHNSRDS